MQGAAASSRSWTSARGAIFPDADPGLVTQTGTLIQVGTTRDTAYYISPEYARADANIDGRTDIYSLGATFFHMLTGVTPFQGPTPATVVLKHLYEDVPDVRSLQHDIPDGVALVVMKMMAKDPHQRYSGCADLISDLDRLRDGKTPLVATNTQTMPRDAAGRQDRNADAQVGFRTLAGRRGRTDRAACSAAANLRRSSRRCRTPAKAEGVQAHTHSRRSAQPLIT